MMIDAIEQRRADAGFQQSELCRRAKVHATTYCRLKSRGGGNVATLQRLKTALDEMISERAAALGRMRGDA